MEDLEKAEELIGQTEIETIFEKIYDNLKKNSTLNINENQDYKNFLEYIGEANEDLEMLEQEFTIPIDPITRTEINIPVRNKKCNHLYDKENFLKLFAQTR